MLPIEGHTISGLKQKKKLSKLESFNSATVFLSDVCRLIHQFLYCSKAFGGAYFLKFQMHSSNAWFPVLLFFKLMIKKNLPHHFETVLRNGAQQSLPDELKWFISAN